MSIEAYVWALKYAPVPPADRDRVVLFALADHADQRGRNAFPSQGTIATYLDGEDSPAGRRKVRRALAALVAGGWITPDPGNPRLQSVMSRVHPSQRPVAYILNLSFVRPPVTGDLTPRTHVTGGQGEGEVTGDPRVRTHVTEPQVTSDHRTVSNPPENRQGGGVGTSRTGTDIYDGPDEKNGAGAPGMDRNPSAPARCNRHAHLPDDDPGPPCHACKAARQARETAAQDQRTARAEARAGCLWCDQTGWRLNPDTGATIVPVIRCDHTPDHHTTPPPPPDLARRVPTSSPARQGDETPGRVPRIDERGAPAA